MIKKDAKDKAEKYVKSLCAKKVDLIKEEEHRLKRFKIEENKKEEYEIEEDNKENNTYELIEKEEIEEFRENQAIVRYTIPVCII